MINIEPYSAERKVCRQDDSGALYYEWIACRVLAIAMVDAEPRYLIESYDGDERWLETVDIVRASTH